MYIFASDMKVTLEFNLPEDEESHKAAIFATEMALVLWETKHNLYKQLTCDKSEEYAHGVERVITEIGELMEYHGIPIDKLTS